MSTPMKVTVLDTLEDIFKYLCDGRKVLCVDTAFLNVTYAEDMIVRDIYAAYFNDKSYHVFIVVEKLPEYEF